MVTIQDVYNQAARVFAQTGVDPAIIATIASTESNLGKSPPFTLGITTAASRGGKGTSGGSLNSSSVYAGSSQPAAFWSYTDGAEAAVAFANYIKAYQPALVPWLGNAQEFFNPNGPIAKSNYYVPTPGGQSAHDYYANWQRKAAQLAGLSPPDDSVASGAAIVAASGGDATPSSSGGGTFTLIPGAQGPGFSWPGIKISTGFLWSAGFFVLAGLLIVAGLVFAFRSQIEATAASAARGLA